METTKQLKKTVLQEEFEFLIDCGYSKPLRDCVIDDKREILECAIQHFRHHKIRDELQKLKEGLGKVKVLPAIQRGQTFENCFFAQTKAWKSPQNT